MDIHIRTTAGQLSQLTRKLLRSYYQPTFAFLMASKQDCKQIVSQWPLHYLIREMVGQSVFHLSTLFSCPPLMIVFLVDSLEIDLHK